jgi:hypothetical protein
MSAGPYVKHIQGVQIAIQDADDVCENLLSAFHPTRLSKEELTIDVPDPSDMPRVLTSLRDFGIAFAGGQHGWPPAEIFADMRDKGLVAGDFWEITFRGPGRAVKTKR